MGTNALVFFLALGLIVVAWAGAGLADFGLWLAGDPTISRWLRQHPRWFVVPAVLTVVFLFLLAVHLFARD